jgi:hypothetical protein
MQYYLDTNMLIFILSGNYNEINSLHGQPSQASRCICGAMEQAPLLVVEIFNNGKPTMGLAPLPQEQKRQYTLCRRIPNCQEKLRIKNYGFRAKP